MEPNFGDKNYLLVDEISYRFRDPQRGEVIVFKYPNNPSTFYIKRIVGLPGEKVEIKQGGVYISSSGSSERSALKENYLVPELKTAEMPRLLSVKTIILFLEITGITVMIQEVGEYWIKKYSGFGAFKVVSCYRNWDFQLY